ncbi:heparan-alpha-glucosaminide N-acetyltransferase [uncultured Oscillibacter sp.]|uniref:heparan-alpha-glucosaminide N-acetyltransferase n=1 Tax=uncultured Oscillibacter sp. TaxID=876091 RepID=UPI0026152F5C|nr:heparan-alpha-glucosaminide N-acetyltransferase [uncultured Oscillibacter sp.]
MERRRYQVLDTIRGLALVSMILYHASWDMVYMFGADWPWYHGFAAHVWQQSICWTFILLSGYCWSLGRRQLRRGLTVFLCGALITAVTWFFMPGNLVYCGVLTLLGASSMLLVPLAPALERVPAQAGAAGSFLLFLVTRDVNAGFLGFEGMRFAALPAGLYRDHLTALPGFPPADFFSTDYFSLFPWFFLFLTGWFLFRLRPEEVREIRRVPLVTAMGRHSLLIYMLHQPVVYGLLWALFRAG